MELKKRKLRKRFYIKEKNLKQKPILYITISNVNIQMQIVDILGNVLVHINTSEKIVKEIFVKENNKISECLNKYILDDNLKNIEKEYFYISKTIQYLLKSNISDKESLKQKIVNLKARPSNKQGSEIIGKEMAKRVSHANIFDIVVDTSGYKYTGRVSVLISNFINELSNLSLKNKEQK